MKAGARKPAVAGGFGCDVGGTGGGAGAALAAPSGSWVEAPRLEATAAETATPVLCIPEEKLLSNARTATPSLSAWGPGSMGGAGETPM